MKKRFKVLERKFQISSPNELSKGCRVSKIIKCVVEDLDSGQLLKIKSKTASGLEKKIIDKIDDFDCECGDILFIEE
jgi:hypothetical protein